MVEVFVFWEMIAVILLLLQQEKDPGHRLRDGWRSERLRGGSAKMVAGEVVSIPLRYECVQ